MLLLVLRLLRLLLLLFTLSMMQEFIGVKLLYEDQCTITKRRHLICLCVCVIVRHLGSANCHAPPRLPFPIQLWPQRVNYLVIIFPHNAQKFSSPLINWISHAQCGKPSLPPIDKHLSINLQNNAVFVFLCVCVCEAKTGSSLCNVWDLTFCAALFVATAMTNEWWKSKTMLLPINGNCNMMMCRAYPEKLVHCEKQNKVLKFCGIKYMGLIKV